MPTESFRDFYSRIKNPVRIRFANADEATLVKIAIREFKLKVPNLVRNNVNFKTCQSDSVFLVDFAQSISDAVRNQTSESNFLRTNNRGRGQHPNRGNRGNFRGSSRNSYNRGQNRPNFNMNYTQAPPAFFNSGSFNYRNSQSRLYRGWNSPNQNFLGQNRQMNNIRCHNCHKMGQYAKNCFRKNNFAAKMRVQI